MILLLVYLLAGIITATWAITAHNNHYGYLPPLRGAIITAFIWPLFWLIVGIRFIALVLHYWGKE